jgi:hypothetical protein
LNPYLDFLKKLYENPKRLQADFCRYNAFMVAEAASRGHISSIKAGVAHNKWVVTKAGVEFITSQNVEVFK